MDLQYIKRAFQLLREDLLQTTISILGSALSIAMIVTLLIANRAESMSYPPEVNRAKTLYVKWVVLKEKKTDQVVGSGYFSPKMIDECFRSLETPQYVTASMPVDVFMASIPGAARKRCYVLPTDEVFWNAYQFRFTEGEPYTKADFDAGLKKIVVSRKFIRQLLGTADHVVGRQIQLNYITYTITGVVEDTFPMLDYTYAQAWIPFTSLSSASSGDKNGITGPLRCQIVPYSASDIKTVRKEIEDKIRQYNSTLPDIQVDLYGQPDKRYKETKRFGWGDPGMRGMYIKDIATILIVFIVPAINLSGFTLSRMRKRQSELAIRKAFGSTKGRLMRQILFENVRVFIPKYNFPSLLVRQFYFLQNHRVYRMEYP